MFALQEFLMTTTIVAIVIENVVQTKHALVGCASHIALPEVLEMSTTARPVEIVRN